MAQQRDVVARAEHRRLGIGDTAEGSPSDRLVDAVEGLLKVIVRGRGEPVRRGVPLNQKQRMALREVVDQPGIRFHELVDALSETKATTSRVVSSLRELGLVNVVDDPFDRRTLLIAPTRAGRKLALQRRARLQQVLDEAFADVPDVEKERFIALLSELGPALRRRNELQPHEDLA